MSKKTSIVPFGWKRVIEASSSSSRSVTYISPSGAVLSSIVEVCQYLEKDDTCKCGLQCPIHVPKVFSFNPEVQSINLSEKEWCQQENKTESHRKNCQHWNKLQKTQIGKKKAPCHSELTIEPPPKLLIIRKDGQLRSVIPDKRKASSGGKKSAGKDIKLPISPSSATSSASRKSSTTSLKSPLFEPGVSSAVMGATKSATKSKSDFKLQWIKADDEVSQNDGESGNELCFSPDSKKSPPMSFPQSLITGISSPPSLFKQEGQFAMPGVMHQRALFMQGGNNTGLPSLHGGVEPVHRFGMSAFPGSNFVLKNDPSSTSAVQNSFPQEIQRHPLMAVKSEQGHQFHQPSHFGFPTSMAPSQSRRFGQPGAIQEPHGGMFWQQNQNSQLAGNVKLINSNMSGVRPRGQLKSPTRQPTPQQFPLGSPTMLNPTSPFGFQMGNSGQNAALLSPGQSTDPSPFSNRPLSRSSSIGTPAPSPGGHWQGTRPQIPDYSRPHSRSSNATTPGPDASPSQMPQWNPGTGNPGIYAPRNPGSVRTFTPNLSPGPRSPFSPTRLSQSSNISRLPINPQGPQADIPRHGFPINQSASQQLRFHSQNVQQRSQQGKNGPVVPYQPSQSQFGATGQFHGLVPPSVNAEQNPTGLHGNTMFRPCPPYRPARIQFARINETDSGGNQPRFPFRPAQPQPRNMQYQGPMMQQSLQSRFVLEHQQYGQFRGPLPTIRPGQYMQPGMISPGLGNPRGQTVQTAPKKPKRPRRRRVKQPVVKKSEAQQALNTNFMSTEFPDFFEPTQISHAVNDKITNPMVSATDVTGAIVHKQDVMKVSGQFACTPTQTTKTVATPNLVMPSAMQGSQSSQAGLITAANKPTPSPLRPPKPEYLAVSESQPTAQDTAQPLDMQKDHVRGVTTPPLPVLSPTCLFEEAHKGDDDDDFSDFVSPSPAVFNFPLSVPSSPCDTSSKKAGVASSSVPAKVTCSPSVSVSTANAIPTPIVSIMIKQSNVSGADLTHESTCDSATPVTSQVSSHFSAPARLRSVQYAPSKSQTVSHDSTSLVSSSGKIFHLPDKTSVNVPKRRHSDHGHSQSKGLDLSVRRRLRSDPYSTGQSYGNVSKLRRDAYPLTRSKQNERNDKLHEQSSKTPDLPLCSNQQPLLSSESGMTTKEIKSLDTAIVTAGNEPTESFEFAPKSQTDTVMSSSMSDECVKARKTDSTVDSSQITLHPPQEDSLNQNPKTSEDDITSPSTTASMSSLAESAENSESENSNDPIVDATMPKYMCSRNDISERVLGQSGRSDLNTNEPVEIERNLDVLMNQDVHRISETKEEVEVETPDDIKNVEEKSEPESCTADNETEDKREAENSLDTSSNDPNETCQGETTHDEPMQTEAINLVRTERLDEVPEPEVPTPAVNISTEMEMSVVLASEKDSSHLKVNSQEKVTGEDPSIPRENIAEEISLPELTLEANIATEIEVNPISQSDYENHKCVSVTTVTTMETDENQTASTVDKLSSCVHLNAHKEISSEGQCSSGEVVETKKSDLDINEPEVRPTQSDHQDLEITPKPDDALASSIAEQHENTSWNDESEKGSPSVECEVDEDAPSAITQEATMPEKILVDKDSSNDDFEQGSKSYDHAPETEGSDIESDSKSAMDRQVEDNVLAVTEQQVDDKLKDQRIVVSACLVKLTPLSYLKDFGSSENQYETKPEIVAACNIPAFEESSESPIQTQEVEEERSEESTESESCLALLDEEASSMPNIAEKGDEELNTSSTAEVKTQIGNHSNLEDEITKTEQKVADDTKEKTEIGTSEIGMEQHGCRDEDSVVVKPISSNASQTKCTISSGLAISPDLTNTVIRQLSNYNTILKNLLVSGVGDPATIAQLTSAASEQDETRNKVLSALINNTMQKLFKEEKKNSPLVSSSEIQRLTQPEDAESVPSTSGIPKVITEVKEQSSTQITSAFPISEPVAELMSEAIKRDLATVAISQVATQPASSPNHGLQVPIVSSSVKGSSQSEEEDCEHKSEVSTLKSTEERKPVIQNEVSTSVKGSETVGKQPPEAIVIAQSSIPEKRRTRTRNATSKQYTKRPERGDASEKATKRSSGSTGSSSSNSRAPPRSSSERQNRNVKSGDLVWGQMRGFPSWPGKVVKPSEVRGLQQRAPLSEGKVWVKWFGDHTFTQMNPADLVSMTEGLEAHHKSRKKGRTRTRKISAHLETAIQEAVDELEQQQGSIKKLQVPLVPVIPIVAQPTLPETTEKPRRGRKRKAT